MLVGSDHKQLEIYQMVIRGVIIFFFALFIIRIAGTRTLENKTIFDQIISLILGAILGRAIVTAQSIPATLAVVLVLLLLHRFIAWITFRSRTAGFVIKGRALLLVKDGELQWKNMRRSHITIHDIEEKLRLIGCRKKIEEIKECYLERSGIISVVE